jgi:hypothetical protein
MLLAGLISSSTEINYLKLHSFSDKLTIFTGGTIQTAINVAFDTIVFLVTLHYTLSTFKIQRSLQIKI